MFHHTLTKNCRSQAGYECPFVFLGGKTGSGCDIYDGCATGTIKAFIGKTQSRGPFPYSPLEAFAEWPDAIGCVKRSNYSNLSLTAPFNRQGQARKVLDVSSSVSASRLNVAPDTSRRAIVLTLRYLPRGARSPRSSHMRQTQPAALQIFWLRVASFRVGTFEPSASCADNFAAILAAPAVVPASIQTREYVWMDCVAAEAVPMAESEVSWTTYREFCL